MKRSHKRSLTLYSVLILIILAAAATYGATHVAKHHPTKSQSVATADAQLPQRTSGTPQFSFTGTADWKQGPTDKISMALFQNSHACFTSVEHKLGTVNVRAELKKRQSNMDEGGHKATMIGTKTLKLQTTGTSHQYKLHQLSATNAPGSEKIKAGQEFGYIQLPSSYIEVEGWCDEPDQLPATIPALQAIKFNGSNSL